MMRFSRFDVEQLLNEQFEQVEALWEQDPYDELNAVALTIKEFMADHQIGEVHEGIRRFVEFKREQNRQMAAVGLGSDGDYSGRLPSSRDLAPQAA